MSRHRSPVAVALALVTCSTACSTEPPSGVDGRPSGLPLEVLAGFVDEAGNARGRPVGVAIDTKGALLVADDVGNTVWRVTSAVPAH